MAVTCASEGLYLGRLSLLEGELRVGTTDREVRRFFADWNHRIIGNGLLCARGAGVRRTFLARVGLRLGNLHARLPPPPSFQRLMQKDHQALQRRLGNKDAAWSGRTEHQAQHVDFDGLALQVPPGVFVPRRSALPSVEAGHELAQATGATRLLDCGTGSGCIALALLRRLPHATVVAIDQDVNAVACARQNAQALGLEERAKVHQMRFDELRDVVDDAGFDLAVSNPPYLPERLMSHVGYARELQSQSVKAFAAGEDGLGAYRQLAECLPDVLKDQASVVMSCQPGKAAWAAQPFIALGYEATPRDAAVQQILALTTDPDGPPTTGIEEVDEISNLAGVTLQYGNHVTAGSLESLRWATYDAAGAKKQPPERPPPPDLVDGIWAVTYQPWYTGSWSEPAGDPIWCFLLWLARVGNATYEPHGGTVPGASGECSVFRLLGDASRFQFSEDFQQAEIIPKGHFGWADGEVARASLGGRPSQAVSRCKSARESRAMRGITRNYMVQADSSVKGDHWERFQGLRPVFQKMIGATSQKERR
ncbi:unnamed protein product [Durusdinium trenchii]|uniref:Methyltransferase small domain-containing protein n=1 Tax=Durusdinium trenchii TaxID=1381693 RepID=A0ABP0JYK9_9DINO